MTMQKVSKTLPDKLLEFLDHKHDLWKAEIEVFHMTNKISEIDQLALQKRKENIERDELLVIFFHRFILCFCIVWISFYLNWCLW